MTSLLVDDLQLGSTRLTAGALLADDEVQRAIDAGGLVVSDNDAPFNLCFAALPDVERLKARGDFPAARLRMMRAYVEAVSGQAANAQTSATYAQASAAQALASPKFPARLTVAIAANSLQALAVGVKTFTVSGVLPARAVLLGFSLGHGDGYNDNQGTGGASTWSLACPSFFTGENVKRGVGVYPRRPTSPSALAFTGNDESYSGATVNLTLTGSVDLNTADTVGGVTLTILYCVPT